MKVLHPNLFESSNYKITEAINSVVKDVDMKLIQAYDTEFSNFSYAPKNQLNQTDEQ